jgi:hypothetical protein
MYNDYVRSLSPDARRKLTEALKGFEMQSITAAADERRAAKLQAAMSDANKEGAIAYVKGCLRRIGLDFVAASDMNRLNTAMAEHKLDTARRIELKRLLGELGVID